MIRPVSSRPSCRKELTEGGWSKRVFPFLYIPLGPHGPRPRAEAAGCSPTSCVTLALQWLPGSHVTWDRAADQRAIPQPWDSKEPLEAEHALTPE